MSPSRPLFSSSFTSPRSPTTAPFALSRLPRALFHSSRSAKMVTVKLNGQTLAESSQTKVVEGNHVRSFPGLRRTCSHADHALAAVLVSYTPTPPALSSPMLTSSSSPPRLLLISLILPSCDSKSPPSDVKREFFTDSQTHTTCGWKVRPLSSSVSSTSALTSLSFASPGRRELLQRRREREEGVGRRVVLPAGEGQGEGYRGIRRILQGAPLRLQAFRSRD